MPFVSEVTGHLATAVAEWELRVLLLALAAGVGWVHARHGCVLSAG
ncbi:MAG: hypothetical protein KBC66_05030 [Kiritimatiellae bacterium]|jgi:3-oxoacyl-(acyl-carrier-protein) synthase|nr:hypothetical protein [Kiritimatiellia bacterium]NLD90546.1 hypothetical protein [Lentisphaerota bacterium]HOU21863.1 hypothetical protein [Kiritimatiellia bacterium]HPC19686.1 hypothetical protein [Kiritimatiellia bacterium]HQN79963.1 hypothetical protein [Kiritimatiellia bacterium]